MSEQTATQTVTQTPIEYANHLTISCSVSDLDRAIDWYRELLDAGVLGPGRPSALSTTVGMRFAGRLGLLRAVQLLERYWDRRLLAAG